MNPQQKALIRRANGLLTEAIGLLRDDVLDALTDEDIEHSEADEEAATELDDLLGTLDDIEARLEYLAPSDEPKEAPSNG